MELHEFVFNAKAAERARWQIIGMGDLHFGTESFDEKRLKDTVKWIASDPYRYWVGLGDYCELITYRDMRRFNPENIDRRFRISDLQGMLTKQIDAIGNILFPVRKRCIGLADGNHEFDALRNYDREATQRLCQNLGTKHLGWTSLTRLVFRRKGKNNSPAARVLTMLVEHSNFAGRKKGGKINRLEDRISDFSFDIMLCGHSHDKVATTRNRLFLPTHGKLELKDRKIIMGIVPSFLRTYQVGTTSYGERNMYSPASLGVLVVNVWPFLSANTSDNRLEMTIEQ